MNSQNKQIFKNSLVIKGFNVKQINENFVENEISKKTSRTDVSNTFTPPVKSDKFDDRCISLTIKTSKNNCLPSLEGTLPDVCVCVEAIPEIENNCQNGIISNSTKHFQIDQSDKRSALKSESMNANKKSSLSLSKSAAAMKCREKFNHVKESMNSSYLNINRLQLGVYSKDKIESPLRPDKLSFLNKNPKIPSCTTYTEKNDMSDLSMDDRRKILLVEKLKTLPTLNSDTNHIKYKQIAVRNQKLGLYYDAHVLPIEGVLQIPIVKTGSSQPVVEWSGNAASNIEISLNGHQYVTHSRHNGSFIFHNIPTGVYLLDVLSVHEVFPQLKIKVNAESGVIKLAEYKHLGSKRLIPTYPIILNALSEVSYFEERPPFSILGFIMSNPMMIMIIFSALAVFGMPHLLGQLSEEDLKEMEQRGSQSMPTLEDLLGTKKKDSIDE